MNLLRSMLKPFNRRISDQPFTIEKRGGVVNRLNAASERVDNAIDELSKTVSMKRDEFEKFLEKEMKK